MTHDKQHFLNMLAAGLCSQARIGTKLPPTAYLAAGLRTEKREPVAYLYGDPIEKYNEEYASVSVGLRRGDTITYYLDSHLRPPLPEWDRTSRPVACLISSFLSVTLDIWEKAPTVLDDGDSVHGYGGNGETLSLMYYESDYRGTVWEEPEMMSYSNMHRVAPFWTNTDLYFTTGELYLAASEPIPVFELVEYINNVPIYE